MSLQDQKTLCRASPPTLVPKAGLWEPQPFPPRGWKRAREQDPLQGRGMGHPCGERGPAREGIHLLSPPPSPKVLGYKGRVWFGSGAAHNPSWRHHQLAPMETPQCRPICREAEQRVWLLTKQPGMQSPPRRVEPSSSGNKASAQPAGARPFGLGREEAVVGTHQAGGRPLNRFISGTSAILGVGGSGKRGSFS